MSSYEVGDVEVRTAVTADPVIVVEALALLIAAVPAAGGYVVGRAVKFVHDELVHEHQEALERQAQEQAKARIRFEKAQRVRREIAEECNKKISEINSYNCYEDVGISTLLHDVTSELQSILASVDESDVITLELRNEDDIRKIRNLSERLKTDLELISKNHRDNDVFLAFIEGVKNLFEDLNTDDYSFVHNVEVTSSEEKQIKELMDKMENLREIFYTIVNRETERYENCPISSVGVDRIAMILGSIDRELK